MTEAAPLRWRQRIDATTAVEPQRADDQARLIIAPAAWTALAASCERAFPREACGWLAATHGDAVDRVHPATVGGRDRFEFSDADLLALVAAARGPYPPRALYHSHPDGDAVLSALDQHLLAPGGLPLYPLPHLVVAVANRRACAATLYAWVGAQAVPLRRWRRSSSGWSPTP